VGDGELGQHRTAVRGFAQDSFTVSPRVTLLYGARYDYDSLTGDVNAAPRASFTAMATADGRTVLRGGAGAFYDPIPLNVASFSQMQQRAVAYADGRTTFVRNVAAPDIHTPRSINWNLELDRELMPNLFLRLGYRQRDNRFEPVVDASMPAEGDGVLRLRSDGETRYREGQITARYQFHGADQIVASYTRSSAFGNLNDFNTYFGNIEAPVIRPDERGPLPWDAPNRYLFWANVSLPYEFAVFPVLDVRSGFPLSIVDADRNFVGPRNEAGRFPAFVSLDLQVSKRFRVFDHNATIGLKVFNVTDHFNPRDFQDNLASSQFGRFNNSVGRTFRGKWVFEF
jgi:hypothetical protein